MFHSFIIYLIFLLKYMLNDSISEFFEKWNISMGKKMGIASKNRSTFEGLQEMRTVSPPTKNSPNRFLWQYWVESIDSRHRFR